MVTLKRTDDLLRLCLCLPVARDDQTLLCSHHELGGLETQSSWVHVRAAQSLRSGRHPPLTIVGSNSRETAPKAWSWSSFLLRSRTRRSVGSLNLRMSHHRTWNRTRDREVCIWLACLLPLRQESLHLWSHLTPPPGIRHLSVTCPVVPHLPLCLRFVTCPSVEAEKASVPVFDCSQMTL